MKTKTLVIGAITVTALVAGGWALAQSAGPPNGFGPPFMRDRGSGWMGAGTMHGMHGMGAGMKKGTGGHGPGMTDGMGPMMQGRGALADPERIGMFAADHDAIRSNGH